MKKYFLNTFFIFVFASVFSQADSVSKQKRTAPDLATIETIDGLKIKGWLYKMDEENIYLLPVEERLLSPGNFKNPDFTKTAIPLPVSKINVIGLRKRNAPLKGALIGLGVGFFAGAIAGFASGDDPPGNNNVNSLGDYFDFFGSNLPLTAKEKALRNGSLLGIAGSLTGALIGRLMQTKFIIGGKKEVYRDMQGELMERLIVK